MSTSAISAPPTESGPPTARQDRTNPNRSIRYQRPGLARTLSHTAAVTWRNLIQIPRNPQLLVFMVVQPVMFVVLFAFVFGGAIGTESGDYIDFLIPGILVQTVAFGTTTTSVGLADDLSKGIIDRFRSLPMAKSAVLAGRVAADTVRIAATVLLIIAIGYVLGFDFQGGVASAIGMIALVIGFGWSMSWVAALIGLRVSNPEAAQSAGFIWLFPLTFASSVFVPPSSMPEWLQPFAEANPISVVTDAMRSLAVGGATAEMLVPALVWIAAIAAVFMPLAIRAYGKVR